MQALWVKPPAISELECSKIICNFLDTATTSFGRATHYNTRQEQQAAELRVHDELLMLSRDLYAVLLVLPGVTDRSMQVGIKKLLSTSQNGVPRMFINDIQERLIINHVVSELPAQRMMKLFDAFRIGDEFQNILRANNARTRKLVLSTLFSSPRLQLWAVKYRKKVRSALTHAWGKRTTSIINSILRRDGRLWNKKEKLIIQNNIDVYILGRGGVSVAPSTFSEKIGGIYECIRFAFGDRSRLTLPMLVAFERSKVDIHAGSKIPMEVLEGIRSTYHKAIPKEKVLEIVKANLTTSQKMAVQKRAEAAGIKVDMDPLKYDAVKLYIYAFERGLTEPIIKALMEKAKEAAKNFPAHFNSVGIVVDMSASMAGDKTQPLRPIATALAMRDMLARVGDNVTTRYCGECGTTPMSDGTVYLCKPAGETDLADKLLEVLSFNPDVNVIFVISDGYENAPAGRFAEVIDELRRLGITVPIYHLNPVFAAETERCRQLSKGVSTLPVQSPTSLGTTFIRGMIESDPEMGINALINIALKSSGFLPEVSKKRVLVDATATTNGSTV